MFVKDHSIPIPLLQVEALERRYTSDHDKLSEIKTTIKVLRSGYNGEKTINYHLKQLPNNQYKIFHDLRIPSGKTFFQIDVLLLTSKFILMLEGKNHSGTLQFQKNQMIQEVNGTREIYENPISQANRHRILLGYLFGSERIPKIPIEYFIVVCKSSTEVTISPDYKEAENKIIKSCDLLWVIEEFGSNYKKDFLSQNEMERVQELLLKKHTPNRLDILKKFEIAEAHIITGVHCPNCFFIPMNYKWKTWICTVCNFRSKDAHIKAIEDYFLIMKNSITNEELRRFLHLPSSRSATYILSLLNLPHEGKSRYRIYYQNESFPISSNHVFPNKTNTIKK